MKKLYGLFLFSLAFQFSRAQVTLGSTGSAYTQNFNSLAASGTNNTWTNNTTITGWYANPTTYISDNGNSQTGSLYSYGATGSSERALGALTSNGTPMVQFGVRLLNGTAASFTSLTISFTGEQWRQTANIQSLVFEYQVGAPSLTMGTWTANAAFNFTAPKMGTAGPLDGNLAGNQAAVSGTLTVNVAAGQEIWLRWTKTGSTSPGLAIDDISITANGGAATPTVNPGDVVINQLSPDYNNADDEYIELVNKTNGSINLSGLAIRYQAANGNSGAAGGTLSGTLQAKRYWLLSPNANVTVGQTNNLARDGSITAGMAADAGQVALVRVSDGAIIDAVGYGGAGAITGGTYTEGTAAPAPPTDGGIRRSPNGADNNNNATDFVTVANAAIFLRSSAVGSPLPAKFTNLRAVQRGSAVHVSWTNATEDGIRDYTVERSGNGVDFAPVTKVIPTGNQRNGADYTAADASPANGVNYYRIRSTETDGKQSFSNVLKLNAAGTAAALQLYPNPVKGSDAALQLTNLPAGRYLVRVIGADGRVFSTRALTFTEGTSMETLPVNRLPAGIYTVQAAGPVVLQRSFIRQ